MSGGKLNHERHDWWQKKLNGNAARDKIHQRALRKLG
jgi:G:T-mismatch repair DNA endonuclease (very short patch repair protein)